MPWKGVIYQGVGFMKACSDKFWHIPKNCKTQACPVVHISIHTHVWWLGLASRHVEHIFKIDPTLQHLPSFWHGKWKLKRHVLLRLRKTVNISELCSKLQYIHVNLLCMTAQLEHTFSQFYTNTQRSSVRALFYAAW